MADARRTPEWVLLGQAGYPAAAVMAQVERLSNSRPFDDGEQARILLPYLVQEALAGRVPQPVDIAAALGKLQFDTRDPFVRTAMGRLRDRMEKYYSQCARRSEIHLTIPDGNYIVFAPRNTAGAEDVGADIPAIASILEPSERAEVYRRAIVRGRIDALDPDLRVWLVVLASDGLVRP